MDRFIIGAVPIALGIVAGVATGGLGFVAAGAIGGFVGGSATGFSNSYGNGSGAGDIVASTAIGGFAGGAGGAVGGAVFGRLGGSFSSLVSSGAAGGATAGGIEGGINGFRAGGLSGAFVGLGEGALFGGGIGALSGAAFGLAGPALQLAGRGVMAAGRLPRTFGFQLNYTDTPEADGSYVFGMGRFFRYTGRNLTSPDASARAQVQGQYLDPYTNQMVQTTELLAADHFLPAVEITRLSGFRNLSKQMQELILNDSNNLQGLPISLNSSKGGLMPSQWVRALGRPLSAAYVARNQMLEPIMRQYLQSKINFLSAMQGN